MIDIRVGDLLDPRSAQRVGKDEFVRGESWGAKFRTDVVDVLSSGAKDCVGVKRSEIGRGRWSGGEGLDEED